MAIHIACGSWADAEYTGVLYPPRLPSAKRLSVYAKWFDQVEVNSSFYATPKKETVAGWVKQTPPEFTFDIKLHRAFSQSPEKAAKGELLDYLLKGVEPLVRAKKLGAFLLVMAPSFTPARHSLSELDLLAEKLNPHSLAVELRHSDWVKGENQESTLAYFHKRQLSWVAVDMPRIKDSTIMPPIDEVTNPRLAYLRLHGRNKQYLEAESAAERHTYEYTAEETLEIVERIHVLAGKAENVHVVANNHAQDFAPKTALALRKLLGQPVPEAVDVD